MQAIRRDSARTAVAGNTSPTETETSSRTTADPGLEVASTRSRASSIFSTGTITSINTLPQPPSEVHNGPIDIVLGRRNFRISARPGSILSISSFDTPAPPYSEAMWGAASESTLTLTAGEVPSSPTTSTGDAEHATPVPRRHQLSRLLTRSAENGPSVDASQDDLRQSSSLTDSRSSSPPSPPLSPLTASTNAISAHYTGIVRTIDANHRVEIERLKDAHAAALAQTRNDIDNAYRGPYREARDRGDKLAAEAESLKQKAEEFQIELLTMTARCEEAEAKVETLRTKLAAGEKETEARIKLMEMERAVAIQRAKNEVESYWGKRMKLAAEEIQRAWEESRAQGEEEGRAKGRLQGALEQIELVKSILLSAKERSPSTSDNAVETWVANILSSLEQAEQAISR